jgi:hypothetical protein
MKERKKEGRKDEKKEKKKERKKKKEKRKRKKGKRFLEKDSKNGTVEYETLSSMISIKYL